QVQYSAHSGVRRRTGCGRGYFTSIAASRRACGNGTAGSVDEGNDAVGAQLHDQTDPAAAGEAAGAPEIVPAADGARLRGDGELPALAGELSGLRLQGSHTQSDES